MYLQEMLIDKSQGINTDIMSKISKKMICGKQIEQKLIYSRTVGSSPENQVFDHLVAVSFLTSSLVKSFFNKHV